MALLDDFFTPKTLAAELQKNQRTLRKWDALGIGPPKTQLGRMTLYRRDSVVEWLKNREQGKQRRRRGERR